MSGSSAEIIIHVLKGLQSDLEVELEDRIKSLPAGTDLKKDPLCNRLVDQITAVKMSIEHWG